MASTQKTGTVSIRFDDQISKPMEAVARHIAASEKKIAEQAKALEKSGFSDSFVARLKKIGAETTHIEGAAQAFQDFAKAQGLAGNTSWSKEQAAAVRSFESISIASIRQIRREEAASAAARHREMEQQIREQQQAARAMEHAMDHHGFRNYVAGMAAAAVSAHSIVESIKESLMAGAKLQSQFVKLQNLGVTDPKEIKLADRAVRDAVAKLPTATYAEGLATLNETVGKFGSLHHAIENLQFMLKAGSVLKASAGDSLHASTGEMAENFAKFFEMRGSAAGPKFQREAGAMVQAMAYSGGRFNPQEMQHFAMRAGPATLGAYSERYMTKIMPTLVGNMKGDAAGTQANAFRKLIMGTVSDQQQAQYWMKLGLLDQKQVNMKKGHVVSWKAGAVKNTRKAMEDPLAFFEEDVLPAIAKHGNISGPGGVDIKNQFELSKSLALLVRKGTANAFAEELSQENRRSQLHKDEAGITRAGTMDEQYKRNISEDPTVAIGALHSSIENLTSAATLAAMKSAAGAMTLLAQGINGLAEEARKHPIRALAAASGLGGAALGGSGYLAYKFMTAGTVLNTAGVELQVAAKELMATGGAKAGAAGVVEGKKPGFWSKVGGLTIAGAIYEAGKAAIDLLPKPSNLPKGYDPQKELEKYDIAPKVGSAIGQAIDTFRDLSKGAAINKFPAPTKKEMDDATLKSLISYDGAQNIRSLIVQSADQGVSEGMPEGAKTAQPTLKATISAAVQQGLLDGLIATSDSAKAVIGSWFKGVGQSLAAGARDGPGIEQAAYHPDAGGGRDGSGGSGGSSGGGEAPTLAGGIRAVTGGGRRRHGRGGGGGGTFNDDGTVSAHPSGVSGNQDQRALAAMNYLITQKGYTPEAAAIVAGNAITESHVMGNGPAGDHGTAHGMFQWRFGRFADLKAFAAKRGKPWTDFYTQLDYFDQERKSRNDRGGLQKNWHAITDMSQAYAVSHAYEQFGVAGDRVAQANRMLRLYKSNPGAAAAAMGAIDPSTGGAVPRSGGTPSSFHPDFAFGDSLASGLGLPGDAVVGRSPRQVLDAIRAYRGDLKGKNVVLSGGVSNNPRQRELVRQQIAALKARGANVSLLGVGRRRDIAPNEDFLRGLAREQGVGFTPLTRNDGVHPKSYQDLRRAIEERGGLAPAPTPPPAPSPATPAEPRAFTQDAAYRSNDGGHPWDNWEQHATAAAHRAVDAAAAVFDARRHEMGGPVHFLTHVDGRRVQPSSRSLQAQLMGRFGHDGIA